MSLTAGFVYLPSISGDFLHFVGGQELLLRCDANVTELDGETNKKLRLTCYDFEVNLSRIQKRWVGRDSNLWRAVHTNPGETL